MKFLQILAVILIIATVVECKNLKKVHKHKDAQWGKNYRTPWANMSDNPLPKEYFTHPVSNYAPITDKKFRKYNRYIAQSNGYINTTGRLSRKAKGLPVSYKLEKGSTASDAK
jgi:hypothetical protein